jgi:hypothetical protein
MRHHCACNREEHCGQSQHARQSNSPGKPNAGTVVVILRKVLLPLFSGDALIVKVFVIHNFWEHSETFPKL